MTELYIYGVYWPCVIHRSSLINDIANLLKIHRYYRWGLTGGLNLYLLLLCWSLSISYVLCSFVKQMKADYFMLSGGWVVPLNTHFSVFLFTWTTPSHKQHRVFSNNAPLYSCFFPFCDHVHMSYIPVADAGVHPVCGCYTEHMHCHHQPPKQSKLSSQRVAPKHIGYISTSKTHYQFGHMLENRTLFHSRTCSTAGCWQWKCT